MLSQEKPLEIFINENALQLDMRTLCGQRNALHLQYDEARV
jgi:hypothetical protein